MLEQAIRKAGTYAPDARHAIVRVPGSTWRIVDSWYDPADGALLGLGVHYDADDPAHEFVSAADFAPLPSAKSLARDLNAPFMKANRMAEARMTRWHGDFATLWDRHDRALAKLAECLTA